MVRNGSFPAFSMWFESKILTVENQFVLRDSLGLKKLETFSQNFRFQRMHECSPFEIITGQIEQPQLNWVGSHAHLMPPG